MSGFVDKVKAGWGKVSPVLNKIEEVITVICKVLFRLRKIVMAAPVVLAALKLAADNAARLPESVGLNFQANGDFAVMVTRQYAVYGPLGVTLFCLMLMFFSRKATFPWVVSIFSLVLPYLIYIINFYPG